MDNIRPADIMLNMYYHQFKNQVNVQIDDGIIIVTCGEYDVRTPHKVNMNGNWQYITFMDEIPDCWPDQHIPCISYYVYPSHYSMMCTLNMETLHQQLCYLFAGYLTYQKKLKTQFYQLALCCQRLKPSLNKYVLAHVSGYIGSFAE